MRASDHGIIIGEGTPGPAMCGPCPCFAGAHRLIGNGEMTGLEWVRESGLLTSPVAVTNTHSVGVVRDALLHDMLAAGADGRLGAARCGRDLGRGSQRRQRRPRAG